MEDAIVTKGTLAKVLPLNNKNLNYPKQDIIITVDSSYTNQSGEFVKKSYPRKIQFENDKIDQINNFNIGDLVAVHWYPSGFEWQSKQQQAPTVYNVDKGWSISSTSNEKINEDIVFQAAPELDAHKENLDAQFPGKNDLPF